MFCTLPLALSVVFIIIIIKSLLFISTQKMVAVGSPETLVL